MNSSAPAICAARVIMAMVALGRAAEMFSRMVPVKRKFSCGTTPMLRRKWSRSIWRRSMPSILMVPSYSRFRPCSRRVTVVLPEPLRPMTPKMVPSAMVNDTPFKA